MSDLANWYCRGYVITPIVEACQQRGLFEALDTRAFQQRIRLIGELKANPGYFTIALEALESSGWLEKNDDAFRLSLKANSYRYRDLSFLYASEPEQIIRDRSGAKALGEKIDEIFLRFRTEAPAGLDPAEGAILVPLVAYLRKVGAKGVPLALRRLERSLSERIIELFKKQQWLTVDAADLTISGEALLKHPAFHVVMSYRPILEAIPELLFGDHDRAFCQIGDLKVSQSRHVALSHENVVADLREEIVQSPDWGPQQTPGVEFEETGVNFDSNESYWRYCAEPLLGLKGQPPGSETLFSMAAEQPAHYLDSEGGLIDAPTVLRSWQQHLRELAETTDRSRFLIVQAHAGPSALNEWGVSELLQMEWIHRLNHEYLIAAETFITLAAGVGLFSDDCVKRYPHSSVQCQISLQSLTKRDYIVRQATPLDVDRLWQLEKECWRHSRTPKKQILARIQQYPEGQFVLEKDERVLAVVYSQRIITSDALISSTAADVHKLHDPSGSIIQLLAVNVDPEVQNASYGDRLLEFILQRSSLMTNIEKVVGVTLCKRYESSACPPFDAYIRQTGSQQDPILAFHQAHGAEVVRAIPGYRPEDHVNLSNGVLVAYDILNRPRRHPQNKTETSVVTGSSALSRHIHPLGIVEFVRGEAARLLGIRESELDLERPVMEMGLDSADLLKLQRLCEERFGIRLAAGFFFEYSSIGRVIEYLTVRFAASPQSAGDAVLENRMTAASLQNHDLPIVSEQGTPARRSIARDIAIVGMACRLPGGIETPDQLWRVLTSNECVIGSFPKTRRSWPSSSEYPGIDQGGFVRDADAFDAGFFRISPVEAQVTDPQQRMLLELAWSCLEDAGTLPKALRGSNTGVFVGASNCDYSRLLQEAGLEIEAHNGVGSSLAILANRISYFFDLSGPSLVIDTACSSSLVALHWAVQALRQGECGTALVGGVNLICHPDLSIAYHKAGMLAPDGRCKVFDAKADGYVRSEGAVMLLLKPLEVALSDRDRIHAVILGGATNHGGLASGLTVPNPQKQKELLMAAWKDAAISTRDLSYIEAHGTGTALGDPIEVQGIHAAYAEFGEQRPGRPCSIGSVKSNLGHLESAAGITGLLKVVLSLQHQLLPASVNFSQLNPKIHLDSASFVIQDRLAEWKAEHPRVAGISSFGSGGANAHVVVREYSANVLFRNVEDSFLFVLSAATDEQLRDYANRIIHWLEREMTGAEFPDAIFTLQVGRTAMKQRLAIKATDHLDLRAKLKAWLEERGQMANVWSGDGVQRDPTISRLLQTKSGQQIIDQALAEKDLELLGTLWVAGTEIDWRRYYANLNISEQPHRISVPTYPFLRESHWIDRTGKQSAFTTGTTSGPAPGFIHRLLHTNTSDLSQQGYRSVFSGEEFFLSDHQIRTSTRNVQKVLPGVACLEMARAAVEYAMPAWSEATVLELRNTVWVQPIVVTGNTEVRIRLAALDNGQIDYEIYSRDGEERNVYCQGRAVVTKQSSPGVIGLEQLKGQMEGGHVEADRVYQTCTQMGLMYGPAFRAITGIRRGNQELLAELRLPRVVETSLTDYVLHPSVMDGAVQASVAWIDDSTENGTATRLPFSLESLRIFSPCKANMVAWVRYSPGSHPSDHVARLDVDLCDDQGTVCVEMRGLSLRVSSRQAEVDAGNRETAQMLLATPVWQASGTDRSARSRVDYIQHDVVLCDLPQFNVQKLETLVPHSQCVSLHSLREGTVAERYSEYALSIFDRIRTVLEAKPQGKIIFQIAISDHPEHTIFVGLSALLKTAALENPSLIGQILLVSPSTATAEVAAALEQAKASGQVEVIKYHNGESQTLGWQEVGEPREAAAIGFKEDGVYLITGGFGGLGLLFAREIFAQASDARVVLIGRRELSRERQRILDELRRQGRRVTYRPVNLENLEEVRQLIAAIGVECGGLTGILHCAGMISDDFILKKTHRQFREVLAPKVHGTFNLDLASEHVELDFFVLFSSIAGAIGNLGQADYATANAFMDHFAAYRNRLVAARRRHGQTRSINWPLWQDGGMKMNGASREMLERTTGMIAMRTAMGFDAFYRSLALPYDQILVAEGNLTQMRRALLENPALSPAPRMEQAVLGAQIESEPLREKTLEYLRKQLSGLLKLPSQRIDPQAGFEEYGIDSMLAMRLTNQLEQTFGSLSKTLFFEYRTIEDLGEYFLAQHRPRLTALFGTDAQLTGQVTATEEVRSPALTTVLSGRRFINAGNAAQIPTREFEPIAIVGLSGRYPEAINIDAYWDNLRDGKDCIIEVPTERWNWRAYFSEDRNSSGRHYSKWGGFIAGVDEFDPLFFNISPREAKFIDPQERLFLEHAWMAVEDAGYTRATLQVSNEQDLAGQVGVYVGVMYSEYQLFGAEASLQDLRMGFAGNLASIANRVSYALNLHGPSMTLDTMCSSSLTAIHVACQDLKLDRTSLAIAGGVNVSIHPNKYLMLSIGQFISSDGHCQSFGEGGDGYIPGEGVGVVVLKRLSDAKRDGDHIYGIIRGSSINHGGRTNGYTVPNPQAQASAISRALVESHTDARHISYIEAHGTGTRLGDPIEIAALSRAFQQYTNETQFCLIGSAKSNIGHCESAAGIAGLTKVLLQMQHRQVAPSLHSMKLNPNIDFHASPFAVNQSLREWEPPVIDGRTLPRIAGISSFGAGGSNAHMIVEEYETTHHPTTLGPVAILLSARTADQLKEKVHDLLNFVRKRFTTVDLGAMAYTLQVGREAMEERVGFVVSSVEELATKLEAYVAGDPGIDDCYQGEVKRNNKEFMAAFSTDGDLQQTLDKWLSNRKLSRLVGSWVRGLEIDWTKLYDGSKFERISLPAYPFARERYWIDTVANRAAGPHDGAASVSATAVLHPLLHSNTSDLTEQRFRSTFTGEEFFLADHQLALNDQVRRRVLPGVACLEMVRAAIEHALPRDPESPVLELRNVVWTEPIVVVDKMQVTIALSANEHDRIDYEIYTQDREHEIAHCQGQAVLSPRPEPAKIDLDELKTRMEHGQIKPETVYATCARMGLVYGPAFRAITEIHSGSHELLVRLRLPITVANTLGDYVLHPSLLDGALQACLMLIENGTEGSNQPRLPFALYSLRLVRPCTTEMTAWVRYSSGGLAAENATQLDIDLCDEQGNVCVQMLGWSLRVVNNELASSHAPQSIGTLLSTPVWQARNIETPLGGTEFEGTEHQVILCGLLKVDVKTLESVVPRSRCLALEARPHKTIAERYSDYALACYERIQSILQGKPQGKVLVHIVIADLGEEVLLAGLSGLLKTATLENPRITGQILLVPAGTLAGELAGLLREEKTGGLDPLVKYANGSRLVLGWQDVAVDSNKPPVAYKDHGVYLITGGLGGLGVLFAREILEKTRHARVVLTGRSPLSAEKQALLSSQLRRSASRLDGLSAPDSRLSYRQVDLGDLDQVKRLITGIYDEYHGLNGILHCAGMISDHFILNKAGAEFSQVLAPKVTGTFNLDQASQHLELDFIVLFSSTAAALGNLAQADYAVANGFMDEFAAYRNRLVEANKRHGRTRSINWPLWQAGGMGIDRTSLELLQRTTGMQPMQTTTGMQAFQRILALPYDQVLVVEGDLAQTRRALAAHGPLPPESGPSETVAAPLIAAEKGFAEIPPADLLEKTQDYLLRQLSDVLKLPPHKIDPQAALEEYGIDSVLALQSITRLERTFGSLSKTLIFEYQTIRALSEYFIAVHSTELRALFATTVNRQAEPPTLASPKSTSVQTKPTSNRFARPRSSAPTPVTQFEPIAIIGLSGRYPGAVNIEAYWNNLCEGKDSIVEIPADRWDWKAYFSEDRNQPGRHYSKWGGFLSGVDEFDPLFFNIAPKEAKYIDPQERLFLEHAWMAVEDAGYTRATLQVPHDQDIAGQVGVYVGVMWSEYPLVGAASNVQDLRMGFAGNLASIANRVSYVLNLHGPSVTLDTMCSSSLSAIHFACQDLKLGRTSLAIAGGVNVSIHPHKYLMLSVGQFISSDGHCQSFGEGGDGYIPGEGVGVVVLKRLSDATKDGDHIYGVIRGSALTHGGKTNGYTVPNPQAQASAISRALAESRTDARHISYIEAHGTGTRLGDPIEIAALTKAFQQHTQDTEFCLIGSAKSNIGHCESAAGIAGLTKVLLQMQHQEIVSSLHSAQLNPHIDFARSPFVVNQTRKTWEQPLIDGRKVPRIAGISSFGAGGSNAHMIVEEYSSTVQRPMIASRFAVVLSARTSEQLQEKARDLLTFVRSQMSTIDPVALAYTLQVGREAMEERLGFVVSSIEELSDKLQAYLSGEQNIGEIYLGEVKRNREALSLFTTDVDLKEAIEKWIVNNKLSKLVDLWAKGLELDWNRLYRDFKPQRISLPTYPFGRERYWIDTTRESVPAVRDAAPSNAIATVLHPLLHTNTSDLSEQRFHSTFTGEEFFLTDHRDHASRRVLPQVAYLEMARTAIERALPGKSEASVIELRDALWGQLAVVSDKLEVDIALSANEPDRIEYEIYGGEAEDQIIHCQGYGLLNRPPAPAPLDLDLLKARMQQGHLAPEAVYAAFSRKGRVYGVSLRTIVAIHRGASELLVQLLLPNEVANTSHDYFLHPSMMAGAFEASVTLFEDSLEVGKATRLPFALDSIRIVSRCTPTMFGWVRYTPGSGSSEGVLRLDIDLCDERGNICAQIRGLSWETESLEVVEPLGNESVMTTTAPPLAGVPQRLPLRREIPFVSPKRATPFRAGRKRPTTISLADPSAVSSALMPSFGNTMREPPLKRSPVVLSRAAGSAMTEMSLVRLYDDGNGVFSIDVATPVNSQRFQSVIALIREALDRVQQETSVKVLIVRGAERCFGSNGLEEYNQAVEQGLYAGIVSFPYPVIAVLQDDTLGAAFLFAALCDFIVSNEATRFRFADWERRFYPTTAVAVLVERFGAIRAQELLFESTSITGSQLRVKGWTFPILTGDEVESFAERFASSLATKSRNALRLLKQHLTRHLTGLVSKLIPLDAVAREAEDRSTAAAVRIDSPAKHIHLDTPADRVLLIKCDAAMNDTARHALVDLRKIIAEIEQAACYKVVVLTGDFFECLPETEPAVAEEVVLGLGRLIVDSKILFVAALASNSRGNGWLVAQFCDGIVHSQTGVYSASHTCRNPVLAQTAAAMFAHRFGAVAAREILLTGADYSGEALQRAFPGVMIAEQDQVVTTAVALAESWSRLSQSTLTAWKKHTDSIIQEQLRGLPNAVVEQKERVPELQMAVPNAIPLESQVVSATAHPGGIVVVKMEDRQARNMFSDALVAGITEAFAKIERSSAFKVVILTGYDSYFASGGTKENLLAIQQGKVKFTDIRIYQAALDSKLPVIAAMQGHGIGAGWSMGLFADIVLLSEESRYVSPYMSYGFTPGAGATYILPEKIGQDLARESLLGAEEYSGLELKRRRVGLRVLPRAAVFSTAIALAKQIAAASRDQLIALKQQFTRPARRLLQETYQLELAMHEKTFVGQTDTLDKIQDKFYLAPELQGSSPTLAVVATRYVDGDALGNISDTLRALLASELQVRESDVDDSAQFVDLGLDSISGVTWIRKINERYHTSIEATKIYSYPTLVQLSRYVKQEAEKLGSLPNQSPSVAAEMPLVPAPGGGLEAGFGHAGKKLKSRRKAVRYAGGDPPSQILEAIAVIGAAGQFPQATNLKTFWLNIAEGRNCITPVPSDRWDVNAYYQPGDAVAGKTSSRWVGALSGYDLFDPLFFNISPTEAESMDPQQRLFLEACWHSIEDAGYDAQALSGSKCGVFVGCAAGDYHQLSRQHQLSAQGFTGSATSILAARISYFLNLQGPCISVDTACSSSLVALAQACDSLVSGASDLALAGGVYVMTGPEMHIKTSQAGMLSPEGKCFTFDQRANGFVPGEGVGVVLLKRLADAERDHDIIHAVVRGWGVNQDGKTNGITAPNPESQTRLEQQVYDRFRINPENIQLIEAHGTGTKLGDPIEVEGLKAAFKKYTQNKTYCALGSVKSNIGHCLTAAGIAGFIKLMLALKHKQLPPTINFTELNEHIVLSDSPFYINTRLQRWDLGTAHLRQAAISSFGFSGTNSHVVIEEYQPPIEAKGPVSVITQNAKTIIPLSAKTGEQLQEKARDLLVHIRDQERPLDLIEMAYTLQIGRTAMDERLGFLVNSVEQLAEKLERYISGESAIADLYRGRVQGGVESTSIICQDEDVKQTIVAKWIANQKLSNLLELWVNGLEVDWNRLYGETKPRRISLPTYPFAKERYWIETAADGRQFGRGTAALHPLLHINASDLSEHRYTSSFSGEESFLRDHRLRLEGNTLQKVLPGVAYLEMVRAAIGQALPGRGELDSVMLKNTIWLKPLIVSESKQISVALTPGDANEVEYEVYSVEAGQKTVHCRGQAIVGNHNVCSRIDLEQLRRQMRGRQWERAELYGAFANMGLHYGPAHQGLASVRLGNHQLLAELHLPAVVDKGQFDYVLHPSLMDSALQSALGLIDDANHLGKQPFIPFALESLRIAAPCTKEMSAWVRYAMGSIPESKTFKVDIDLCDPNGDVCVEMRGFVLRVFESSGGSPYGTTDRPKIHFKTNPRLDKVAPFDITFYESLIADVVDQRVSVDEAAELA